MCISSRPSVADMCTILILYLLLLADSGEDNEEEDHRRHPLRTLFRGRRNIRANEDVVLRDVWGGGWVEGDEQAGAGGPRRGRRNAQRRDGEREVVVEDSSGSEDEGDIMPVPPPRTRVARRRQPEIVDLASGSEYEGSFIDDGESEEEGSDHSQGTPASPMFIVDDDDEDEEDEDGIAATFALLHQTRNRPRRQVRGEATVISSDEESESEAEVRTRRRGRGVAPRRAVRSGGRRRRVAVASEEDSEDNTEVVANVVSAPEEDGEGASAEHNLDDNQEDEGEDLVAVRRARAARAAERRRRGAG